MIHNVKKYSTFNNGEEDLVAVPEKRYLFLKERNHTLSQLEAAGVDNWEGYSQAFPDDESQEET